MSDAVGIVHYFYGWAERRAGRKNSVVVPGLGQPGTTCAQVEGFERTKHIPARAEPWVEQGDAGLREKCHLAARAMKNTLWRNAWKGKGR